jgi:hypothetical protein
MNMRFRRPITLLSLLTAVLAIVAGGTALLSGDEASAFEYDSIRGETVKVFGKGLYKHMPADVAIQGIAQDYVTLFLAVPLLLIALYLYRRGSVKGKLLLTGTLLYFTVSYMIYLTMGMYSILFLVYVGLVACSLLALILCASSFDYAQARRYFPNTRLIRVSAIFLLVNCILIASLWLSIVVPPLIDGSVYPVELYHFTTLIVQGLDLAIFLPLGFVSALFALKRWVAGYVFTTIYLIFLAILMIALTSKVIFMGMEGQNVVPVIFIMPMLAMVSMVLSGLLLRRVEDSATGC